ncbi:hypothetical protein EJB05_57350, partial [Eragrostis curvula]
MFLTVKKKKNRWSLIAARLPGRTDNEIKNYWNTHIKRKLLARGIDPKTHRPLSETAAAGTPTNRQSQEDPPARSSCSPEASGAGHSSDEDSAATGSLPETSQQQQQLTCIDLNLSISPPRHEPSSSSPPPRPNEQGSSTMSMSSTKGTVGASTSNSESERICLCLNRLGLQCDERAEMEELNSQGTLEDLMSHTELLQLNKRGLIDKGIATTKMEKNLTACYIKNGACTQPATNPSRSWVAKLGLVDQDETISVQHKSLASETSKE